MDRHRAGGPARRDDRFRGRSAVIAERRTVAATVRVSGVARHGRGDAVPPFPTDMATAMDYAAAKPRCPSFLGSCCSPRVRPLVPPKGLCETI